MSKPSQATENPTGFFGSFLRSEVSGSVILLACTLAAIAWANSPWADVYLNILHTKVGVSWAGVRLDPESLRSVVSPCGLGIIAGLFLGKQTGFMLSTWLVIRAGKAALPEGVNWMQFWGMSLLAGIGFTMSLFVSELAFTSQTIIAGAKLGILAGSLISAIAGYVVLHLALPRRESSPPTGAYERSA